MNIKRLVKSFRYALRGLKCVVQEEQNFRIQLCIGVFVCIVAFILQVPLERFLFLLCAIFLVLILECVNTALEECSDIVKPRLSDQVKMIKDIMAGAVFLAAIFAIIVGICVFFPIIETILVESKYVS